MLNRGRFKMAAVAVVLGALMAMTGGLVISQAAGGQGGIQALVYNDRVRFTIQNERVSIFRAEVFDLGGKRLFDSGPTMGNALDWNMSSESGERVAHGVYLYVITAWDSQGELVKSQVGKLALVPGGVGLGQAPELVSEREESLDSERGGEQVKALMVDQNHATESWAFKQVGIGTVSPVYALNVIGDIVADKASSVGANYAVTNSIRRARGTVGSEVAVQNGDTLGAFLFFGHDGTNYEEGASLFAVVDGTVSNNVVPSALSFRTTSTNSPVERMRITSSGKVGIGTSNPSATLEVHGSTLNLLALYDPADPSSPKFKVQKDGDVYADRSYNRGLASGCFNAGTGADVAERIDVSEPVEPGDVVEIDPGNPGLYRKAQEAYSTRVAGVISTAPAITLGNNFDPKADRWTDSRPLLALAGRVPVKVTTENGPIKIGDFLSTSSTPGYAMRCGNLGKCTGAILGKALEPLEEGTGTIMVQVSLR